MATKPVEMPYSLEAEQSILGCILIDQEMQNEILVEVEETDFYLESHKLVCDAMKKISGSGKPVDFVTLTDRLDSDGNLTGAGGIEYITTLTTVTPSAANYRTYLEIVKRDSVRRKLIRSAAEIDQYTRKTTDRSEALSFAEKKAMRPYIVEQDGKNIGYYAARCVYNQIMGDKRIQTKKFPVRIIEDEND